MFGVEPMPNKVKFGIQAEEHALLGENYEVWVDIQPEDTIVLKHLALFVENIDFEEIKQ